MTNAPSTAQHRSTARLREVKAPMSSPVPIAVQQPQTHASTRLRRSRTLACVLAGVAILAAAGCTSSATDSGSSKKTLTIGFQSHNSSGVNPATDTKGQDPIFNSLAYAPLIHWKSDGTFGPSLAESWKYVGTGNTTFTLKLRTDARFSDGTPVTASAVKTWLEYFAKAKGGYASLLAFKSIETTGTDAVTINLKAPTPNMPLILSEKYNWGFVASPKAVAKPSTLNTTTDGAGPYVLQADQSVSGDHYSFVPNKYYFNKSDQYWSKVDVRCISNPATMLAAVRSGQVDVAAGDFTTADSAASAGLSVVHEPVEWDGFWILDMGGKLNPALADVRVRQALNYAVDRSTIVKALFGSYGEPTSEVLTNDGFDPSYQNYYAYNPDKAKELLKQAGFSSGLTVTVADTSTRGNLSDPLTQAVAKYWNAVGVHLKISTAPTYSQYAQEATSGKYQLLVLDTEADPMSLLYGEALAPGGPFNQHGWQGDPTLAHEFSAAGVASDPTSNWQEMSRTTVKQAFFIPIVRADLIWYESKNVKGVKFSAASPWPYPIDWSPR